MATATKQQMAELRELRDELVANFREQMVLRHRLMEIGRDKHTLMELGREKHRLI
jgi:DNA-directed RNA polymerase sigma subunit (sigma70/sigma32)